MDEGSLWLMIISRIIGGLGNQMFNYAAGKRLSIKLGIELKLDVSGYPTKVGENCMLDVFNIDECIATKDEIYRIKQYSNSLFVRMKNRLSKTSLFSKSGYIKEKHFEFDPEIISLGDNVYLDGYWQSEKYFIDIENEIRHSFTIKEPQTGENEILAEKIYNTSSVFILVRRGAYASEPEVRASHGLVPLEYYKSCVDKIAQYVPDPHFFVFTNDDDRDWTKENLNLKFPTIYVDHNDKNNYNEDLRLMSQCKHAICSNSSWAWWGAWLITNPQKIVYAPKKWFNVNINTRDLYPPDWILV